MSTSLLIFINLFMKNLFLLCLIFSLKAFSAEEYERGLYGGWIDSDRDCQDTRQEVLIEESLELVVLDESGCKVLSGRWYCPYTNRYFTNPRQLDIDHLVPLAEAHRSGAGTWDREKRKSYANDLDNKNALIAVHLGANRSKGDKDPTDWMPENKEYWCEYIKNWLEVKNKWELTYSVEEQSKIKSINLECYQ